MAQLQSIRRSRLGSSSPWRYYPRRSILAQGLDAKSYHHITRGWKQRGLRGRIRVRDSRRSRNIEDSIDEEQINEVYAVRPFENVWDLWRMDCSSVGFWAPAPMYYHSPMQFGCLDFTSFRTWFIFVLRK
jgi:hypothetical protein